MQTYDSLCDPQQACPLVPPFTHESYPLTSGCGAPDVPRGCMRNCIASVSIPEGAWAVALPLCPSLRVHERLHCLPDHFMSVPNKRSQRMNALSEGKIAIPGHTTHRKKDSSEALMLQEWLTSIDIHIRGHGDAQINEADELMQSQRAKICNPRTQTHNSW